MKRYISHALSLILLFGTLTACGGESGDQQQTSDQSEATAQADDIRTIEVIGIDQMRFVVENEQEGITTGGQSGDYIKLESISAEPGEEIRIRLTTISDLPPSAMAHNWVLLTMDADGQKFTNAASQARDNDYIPADMSDQIIAETDLAAGGETVEVVFTAPDESGDYEYICSFPGHYSGGMKGILTVE